MLCAPDKWRRNEQITWLPVTPLNVQHRVLIFFSCALRASFNLRAHNKLDTLIILHLCWWYLVHLWTTGISVWFFTNRKQKTPFALCTTAALKKFFFSFLFLIYLFTLGILQKFVAVIPDYFLGTPSPRSYICGKPNSSFLLCTAAALRCFH